MPAFVFLSYAPDIAGQYPWEHLSYLYPPNKKIPLSHKDRGRHNTRYHLWFICISQRRPHGVKQRLSLYRATPSFPTVSSEKPLREVFGRVFPLRCTDRQLSGGRLDAYFIPSMRLRRYGSKRTDICQEISRKDLLPQKAGLYLFLYVLFLNASILPD